MSVKDGPATWEEYENYMRDVLAKAPSFPCAHEWSFAIGAGWDREQFKTLYSAYVKSTQIVLKPGDNPTELKGRPLERIAHYLLEQGGVVFSIKEMTEPQKWQVDGQGPLNKTALRMCWGEDLCQQIGFQLYMEAKNHSDPVTNDEFARHFQRMEEHECNFGVLVSTSGYRMARGQGIAESIHRNYWRKRFHLLLVFQSIQAVAMEKKAPLVILQEALCYAVNNSYANDSDIQRAYSPAVCHAVAKAEYEKLFGIGEG
jgi:hypothetical protein